MEEPGGSKWDIREEREYFVVEGDADYSECTDIKMLFHNQVPGILPMQLRYVDNRCGYYYQVAEQISLSRVLADKKLDRDMARQLCEDIYHSCSACDMFFLQMEHFMFIPERIYWSPRNRSFSFCYFPGHQEMFGEQMKKLGEYLLTVTDHNDKAGREFVYGLYDLVSGSSFVLTELEEYLRKHASNETEPETKKEEGGCEKMPAEAAGKNKFRKDGKGEEKEASEENGDSRKPEEQKCEKRGIDTSFYLKNTSKCRMVPQKIHLKHEMSVVGRSPDSDIVLPGAQISWQHARIEIDEEGIFISDVNSFNGVFLNEKRLIKEHPVLCKEGDTISFADITYLLCTG